MKFFRVDLLLFVLGLLFCVILTLFVVFQRDKLEDILYGPLPEESKNFLEKKQDLSLDNDSLISENTESINLIILPEKDGKGLVFLKFLQDFSIPGFELFLKKDNSLEILDFTCIEPFECTFFEVVGDEVFITAMIPLDLISFLPRGKHLVGEFTYRGSGNLYFKNNSDSFISDIKNPEFNLLNSDDLVVFLK